MPETPQQWYERVNAAIEQGGYREAVMAQWASWPWTGELTPKPLDPPVAEEPLRRGVAGIDCFSCASAVSLDPAEGVVWADELFFIVTPRESSSLPFALFLMPRRHTDLADLTPAEAARQGELLALIEQAAVSVLDVPRIQVARWGDGGEHLHWWLYARPTGMLQLRGTFLSHWDDLLPPQPADQARADAELVAAALVEVAGGVLIGPGHDQIDALRS